MSTLVAAVAPNVDSVHVLVLWFNIMETRMMTMLKWLGRVGQFRWNQSDRPEVLNEPNRGVHGKIQIYGRSGAIRREPRKQWNKHKNCWNFLHSLFAEPWGDEVENKSREIIQHFCNNLVLSNGRVVEHIVSVYDTFFDILLHSAPPCFTMCTVSHVTYIIRRLVGDKCLYTMHNTMHNVQCTIYMMCKCPM